mmetsp:Transcript_15714/g.19599  ORF Transcript_15714/g.19599 Transcript_15714/m.19599 type:complete len:105 (+) Transcript_15714:52-366(+)
MKRSHINTRFVDDVHEFVVLFVREFCEVVVPTTDSVNYCHNDDFIPWVLQNDIRREMKQTKMREIRLMRFRRELSADNIEMVELVDRTFRSWIETVEKNQSVTE